MDDSKKKISFIINPISGTQGKEQILKWLDEKLDKSRYIPEVIYTEWAGHAVEIAARKAKEEVFAVVAIGGRRNNQRDSTLIGAHQNGVGHHPMRFRQRVGTPSADFHGGQKSN